MKIALPGAARRRARIEIIPLIDIVFFLLATFVMVSLSMVKNQGIPVNLPSSETASRREEPSQITLTVTRGDELYFDRERMTLADLPARLKAAGKDARVLINGDEDAVLGSAIAVLDEVRKAGIQKVSIQTRSKENAS